jgi:uncharacterized protein YndB with AHSA1/START domain
LSRPLEPLRLSVDLPAPRDEVWAAWTTAAGLASWLCLRARVEPEVGGAFELFWDPDESRPERDSTLGCTVLSVDEPRLLEVTWRGSEAVADVMNAPGVLPTQVRVELRPTLAGTRVEVIHSGWGEGPDWERARAWFEQAWRGALVALKVRCSPPDPAAPRA